MQSDAASKCAVVTGAGSGIGRAAALRLARLGWGLTIVGRRAEALRETAAQCTALQPEHPDAVLELPLDLTAGDAAETIVARTMERFGHMHALVNNAGHAELRPIPGTDRDILLRTFEINVYASAMLIARALPALIAGKGVLVQISSMAAVDPFPGFFVYAAAKAAVESFVRSVHIESGIRSYAVAPGATETPMLRALFSPDILPEASAASPDAIAEVVEACILGRRSEPSGSVIRLAGD